MYLENPTEQLLALIASIILIYILTVLTEIHTREACKALKWNQCLISFARHMYFIKSKRCISNQTLTNVLASAPQPLQAINSVEDDL